MYSITSLHDFRQYLGLASDDTSEDSRLVTVLEATSKTLERLTQRRFLPYQASIFHSFQHPTELSLKTDLLTLQSITNGDSSLIAAEDIQVLGDGSLRLHEGQSFVYEESPHEALLVTGLWGYHADWAQAWRSSGDTVDDNPLAANATTINLTVGAVNSFQVGQLLRLEAEYVFVTAFDSEADTLTVERGVLGTTATSHAQGTSIAIYTPPADVQSLCLAWARWLYQEADKANESVPSHLLERLAALRRVRI